MFAESGDIHIENLVSNLKRIHGVPIAVKLEKLLIGSNNWFPFHDIFLLNVGIGKDLALLCINIGPEYDKSRF
jgi:hypothetical protein